jgi:GPI ethanolamine phosphate transferase 3 subunit O
MNNVCFERKTKKLVIFVVDALKYDFGVYNESIKEPLSYQNKLPIIHELSKSHPEHTRLVKFLADPPTTTLQRLKGITTGSLPTFIDMGSNFATPEINEDNIIDQMVANGLSVTFLGDNTWNELFPKRFKRNFAYPSFNIHDLDTIDNEILKHLPDELSKNDWDVLIAHFLGIDHCGHKYGPLHPEMSRKLTEMNEIIEKIVATIDEDTTLLVFGDHGMTFTGDHGGDSNDEVEALLFAYSKKPFVPKTFDDNANFLQQIDLTSTIATILGVPIPFSNLGTIFLQLLPQKNYEDVENHRLLLMHMWQNAKQIQDYFTIYSKEEKSFTNYESINEKFRELEKKIESIKSEEAFILFARELRQDMDEILEVFK